MSAPFPLPQKNGNSLNPDGAPTERAACEGALVDVADPIKDARCLEEAWPETELDRQMAALGARFTALRATADEEPPVKLPVREQAAIMRRLTGRMAG